MILLQIAEFILCADYYIEIMYMKLVTGLSPLTCKIYQNFHYLLPSASSDRYEHL